MLSIYIHFIVLLLFGCLLAFYFKSLLIVISFFHRKTLLDSAYTFYLSILFLIFQDTRDLYQDSIIRFLNQWLYGNSSIKPDLMPYSILPRLAVTVKSDTCTETVYAIVDTGAYSSYISAKLAKKINVDLSDKNKQVVDVLIGKPNGNEFTKVKLNLFPANFSFGNSVNSSLYAKIANILSIPLFYLPNENAGELLIGTCLIPSLLFSKPSLPPRCISLASNLNLIETRLGYYLQGSKTNSNIEICNNWLRNPLKIYPFGSFVSYVLITFGFVFLCKLDYITFLYLHKIFCNNFV